MNFSQKIIIFSKKSFMESFFTPKVPSDWLKSWRGERNKPNIVDTSFQCNAHGHQTHSALNKIIFLITELQKAKLLIDMSVLLFSQVITFCLSNSKDIKLDKQWPTYSILLHFEMINQLNMWVVGVNSSAISLSIFSNLELFSELSLGVTS